MIPFARAALAGSLAGTVRDADGVPVAAEVAAVGPHLDEVVALAGPDGTFRIEVPDGLYRLRATPPVGEDEAVTWAPSGGSRCDGELYAAGEVGGIDVVLLRGAEIRGTLDRPDGTPAAGALVSVFGELATSEGWVARSDGSFVVSGVSAGDVVVGVAAEGLPYQFWGRTTSGATAPTFAVAAGDALDLGRTTLLAGATVSGTVSGPAGPVAGGLVSAYAPSEIASAPIDAGGRFEVAGLPAGDVLAWATVEGLATTYWPEADRPADRVTVAEGERADGVDLVLPAEATLRGRLAGGGPWGGATAVLYNSDRTIGVGTVAEDDGSFAFRALHGGTYTLWLEGGAGGRVTGEWAALLEVPPGGVLDLGEIVLPEGASLRGRATDAASGAAVPAAYVLAVPDDPVETRSAVTAADGTYAIDGLGPGPWEVWIAHEALCTDDPGWVAIWYDGTPNPLFSAPVAPASGQTLTWDPELPPDGDHDGMDDRWERRHDLDPTTDDGARDPDDDGYSNLEEYLLGTDPTDGEERRCGCGAGGSGALGLVAAVAGIGRRRPTGSSRAAGRERGRTARAPTGSASATRGPSGGCVPAASARAGARDRAGAPTSRR